ncbi:MAG: PaREP1 family protein [Thermoproteota archaeon]
MAEVGRIRLIENLFSEAVKLLERGDPIQSSEKLYKAAEECIKALAEEFSLDEAKVADERGRWTVTLLEKAVGKIASNLGVEVRIAWDAANYLLIWGFHETKLDVEDVKSRIPAIEKLMEITEKAPPKT